MGSGSRAIPAAFRHAQHVQQVLIKTIEQVPARLGCEQGLGPHCLETAPTMEGITDAHVHPGVTSSVCHVAWLYPLHLHADRGLAACCK